MMPLIIFDALVNVSISSHHAQLLRLTFYAVLLDYALCRSTQKYEDGSPPFDQA